MPEARTQPVSPFDSEFRQWVTTTNPTAAPAPTPRHSVVAVTEEDQAMRPRDDGGGGGDGDGGGSDTGGGPPASGPNLLTSFHAYVNSRPDVDWNTCGQAAIASITDFHGLNPYNLPRVGQYWDDGTAIDAVINGGFGADVIFGWGTTGGRIRDALNSYGLHAEVGYSGLFSAGWEDQWEALKRYVTQRLPVPVLVDVGALGGSWWTAHWPIVYRIEGGQVYLGNPIGSAMVDEATFLSAWHCWFLPYGFNHCAVYCY